MLINQAYKYELKPNNKQQTALLKHAGTARFVYNWGLARRITEYKETGKSSSAIDQHKQLNQLKKTDYPWMYDVSKATPQEALRNLDKAFQNFFRNVKVSKKPGFPKFKKRGIHDSFSLTGVINVSAKAIQLPKLKTIRTKEETDVKGRILSATVSREADRWFVSLSVERARESGTPETDEVVGVDVGLHCFAVCSDGQRIESPKPLKQAMRTLKRRSRQHSRKKKGSNNRKKLSMKLARLHRRIKNKREDFLHKTSTMLAKTKSVIVIEDLNVNGMMRNHNLAGAISDAGWGEFSRMLSYKTQWYGSRLEKASRFYSSSKTCSQCGAKKTKLSLSKRTYHCENCGAIIDRDDNASANLQQLYTGSSPGINACGESIRPATISELSQAVSQKQETDARCPVGIFG